MKINLKQLKRLHKLDSIQDSINSLEKDKLHLLFYINKFTFKRAFNPVFLLTRLIFKIKGNPPIDHVGYISNFDEIDTTNIYKAETIDALPTGVEKNDLLDFVKNYRGAVIVASFDKYDKEIIDSFTKLVHGLPYGEISAAMSALDSDTINDIAQRLDIDIENKTEDFIDFDLEKIFCSYKTALLLEKLGYDTSIVEGGIAKEMTPYNVFQLAITYATKIKLFCD